LGESAEEPLAMAKEATKPALAVKTRLQPDPPAAEGGGPHPASAPRKRGEGPDARRLGGNGLPCQWLSNEEQTLFVKSTRREQASPGLSAFRFPSTLWGSGNADSALELIAAGGLYDTTSCEQRGERLTDVAGAHAHGVTHVLLREWYRGLGENLFDALQTRRLGSWSGRRRVERLQGEHWRIGFERKQQAVGPLGGTMFDAELQLLAVAAQIKIGVAPGVKFGRAAQRLTAAEDTRRAVSFL